MLYRETIAVCSQIHTKHINTLCGQNVELLHVKLAVHKGSLNLQTVNEHYFHITSLSNSDELPNCPFLFLFCFIQF